MGNIQGQPDERDLRYLELVTGRLHNRGEEDRAADAIGKSPAELYRQLTNDGFPVCGVRGATHVDRWHRGRKKDEKALR
jgi:hypothetical protein